MTNFEKKLKLLFDAQDFFQDPGLEAIIKDVVVRVENVKPLADDELEQLFAAGDPLPTEKVKDGPGDGK